MNQVTERDNEEQQQPHQHVHAHAHAHGSACATDPVLPGIRAIEAEMVALRHHIHAHPELAFEEFATGDLVAERLAEWGYTVHRGLGGTGVVGTLRLGSSPRVLGLRADMDALPIHEETGLPYASTHQGKMHACGHDGHTAILLAAARHLAKERSFDGTLHLIFQPAEEGLGGGRKMIEDGLFEQFPCDAIFALHNMPGHPVGTFGFMGGPFMASSDSVSITVKGRAATARHRTWRPTRWWPPRTSCWRCRPSSRAMSTPARWPSSRSAPSTAEMPPT